MCHEYPSAADFVRPACLAKVSDLFGDDFAAIFRGKALAVGRVKRLGQSTS